MGLSNGIGNGVIGISPIINNNSVSSVISESGRVELKSDTVDVFINKKYKNVLIVLNVEIKDSLGFTSLNDMTYFDPREGLYYNNTYTIVMYPTGIYHFDVYNNYLLLSVNMISTFNIQNQKTLYNDYITYHYIGEKNTTNWEDYGVTKINVGNINSNSYPLKNTLTWDNNFTPYYIDCLTPTELKIKRNSYQTNLIKGPDYLLNDDNVSSSFEKYFMSEPLSTFIIMSKPQNKILEQFRKELRYEDSIYRYDGNYEPIFKDIELFEPIDYSVIDNAEFNQKRCGGSVDGFVGGSLYVFLRNQLVNYTKQKKYLENELEYINDKIEYVILINDLYELGYLESEKQIKEDLISDINGRIKIIESEIIKIEKNTKNAKNVKKNKNDKKGIGSSPVFSIKSNSFTWYSGEESLICDGEYSFSEITLLNTVLSYSEELYLHDYNFNIPLNANIIDVSFEIKRKASVSNPTIGQVADEEIYLVTSVGTSNNLKKPDIWGTSEQTIEYNDASMITPQQINDYSFGVKIKVRAQKTSMGTTTVTAMIDCVCVNVRYTIPGIPTNTTYVSCIERNTIFDTNLFYFGETEELLYSKTNEKENPLVFSKKSNKTIYPKIDEFGYSWNNRFIFKSSWDVDYYYKTKK